MSLDHAPGNNGLKNNVRDLESLLRKKFGNELILVECDVQQLVPVGENFASNMLKISTKIRRNKNSPAEDLHFVAKSILLLELGIDWTRLLKKEIFLYNDIVPFYKKVELEYGIDDSDSIVNIFPEFFGYRMSLNPEIDEADEDALILLQNVNVQGYDVMDKKIGLDYRHATTAIKYLAKFHALGITAKNRYPTEFEAIKTESLNPGFHIDENYTITLLNMMKKHPSFDKHAKRIEELAAMTMEVLIKQVTQNNLWTTIAHHDFWTNNIMFHHDEIGNIKGVKIIDFQTYTYAHLFVDLPYFLCASLEQGVMLNNFDDLIDVYYDAFLEGLKNMHMDVTPYSREKFDEQLKKDAALEFFHCTLALLYFTTDIQSFNEEQKENVNYAIITSGGNDLFFSKLHYLFEIYERKNWF